jgi:hypothetical protein
MSDPTTTWKKSTVAIAFASNIGTRFARRLFGNEMGSLLGTIAL